MSSSVGLLQRMMRDPHNEGLILEAGALLRSNPREFIQAAQTLLPFPQEATSSSKDGTWSNCIGNQVCTPAAILRPSSLQDLLDAVTQARGKRTVRAVGSGHSYSDVAVTDGLLLDPHGMNQVLQLDASVLKDPSAARTLFPVQSGITIANLNHALDSVGLALINMGAYDAQTLAGAISTGTHGTGAALGPIASCVRSLVLVTESGIVYQLEPRNGISDPVKFAARYPGIILKQDDDWFQSNVVAMGCMGLIYAYTLEVMPAYHLVENRTLTTWEKLKPQLLDAPPGQLPSLITAHRHFEIDVNPYAVEGAHTCVVVTRALHTGPTSGSRGFSNWISGLLAQIPLIEETLVSLINAFPHMVPHLVDTALETLKDSNYIDKSYKVLNLGAANEASAYAIELSFDATRFVASIDQLLALFAEYAKAHNWYQSGPIGIRFTAPAQAYLAPQYGRVTCMAELDMLNGTRNGMNLLKAIEQLMCAEKDVRVHWGLELDTLQGGQIPMMYPQYAQWLSVYRQLNSTGMFDNSFTTRLGISMGSAATGQAKRTA
ncbi:FAD-binding protein [Archangium sp.]|uniref:FAD-binding protein n=1 Tax=Archangium sp. TaxID=1872627 RepID=UPI00389AAB30